MLDQRKRIFAVNSWLLDLVLTTASFLLAYEIRRWFQQEFAAELSGHTVMDVQVYFWILAIILPTWAILLPAFGVYSEPSQPITHQIARLSKAIFFSWLVMAAITSFVNRDETNRIIVLLTLPMNYVLLTSFRFALLRF